MDGPRFDDLTRSLSSALPRRTVVRILVGSALGLLSGSGGAETWAHDALPKCKKIDNKRKRKKCVKKAQVHNIDHNEPNLPGTCTAEQEDLCQAGNFAAANCNATPGCSCYTTARGARFCGTDAAFFCPEAGCQNSADCGAGAACVKGFADCGGCGTTDLSCVRACTSVQTCSGEDRCADPVQAVVCGGAVGDQLQTCFCFKTAGTGDPVCAQFDTAGLNCTSTPCPEGMICAACPNGDRCLLPCANPLG